MKKVLVTGGSGFIGSNLVKKLLEKKYEIVIFDNGFRKGFGKVEEFNDKVTLVKGDVLNIHDWKKLSEEDYRKLFKNSAIKRTKYSGLMRNIKANLD